MRRIFSPLLLIIGLALVGCSAGPSRIEGVGTGMSKAEVLAVLGEPRTTTLIAGSEYLTFKVWRSFWRRQPGNYRDVHYVRLSAGRVAEHGDIRTLPEAVRSQIKE
jgi:flavin-dependent dehydrogenase